MDPREELRCAFESCVLGDRSHFTRLLATGPDFLDLLQRLSTGDVAPLTPGQGRPTILTTSKGRIVERLYVHHLGADGVLAVGGPATAPAVIRHLARYTFRENTGLSDVTDSRSLFVVIGPRAAEAVQAAGLPGPENWGVADGMAGDTAVRVLGGDGLSADGYSIVFPSGEVDEVRGALLAAVESLGGCAAGAPVLEAYRVLRGQPLSGHELTEDFNPLEANQWDAVSFSKGCYVGQEVVARLNTYDKVSSVLVGLELPAGGVVPPAGAALHDGGRRVGRLTSVTVSPDREAPIGLGYLKKQALRPSLELTLAGENGTRARVVELPFRVFAS